MRKALSITLLALVTVIAYPTNAFAHAGVVSTVPAQDQLYEVMPAEISITFSEDLLTLADQVVNTISLTSFDGPPVEVSDLKVDGSTLSARIPEGEYGAGVYEVVYRVVSADGHKVADSFTFSLNAPIALTSEIPTDEAGDGVLPLPIVISILALLIAGGAFIIRLRKR